LGDGDDFVVGFELAAERSGAAGDEFFNHAVVVLDGEQCADAAEFEF